MKKKFLLPISLCAILFGMTTCSKKEEAKITPCLRSNSACSETPPQGLTCQAVFTGWFYDRKSKRCEEISYSGCSQMGFATKQDCLECICN